MSISINVNGMNYNNLSCAQRAVLDEKRKNRLVGVRQQSKEIAQKVRAKVQCEKENQLRRLQEIKRQELNEWKRKKQCEIQRNYAECLPNLGAAHLAACDASCEENEIIRQKHEENDLIASARGRAAMLQEQRKRDREAEERLMKKKRQQQKTIGIQADFINRRSFGTNLVNITDDSAESESDGGEETGARAGQFVSKPNIRKGSSNDYNAKNFTTHSVDSSNHNDSDDIGTSSSAQENDESEMEFDQITKLIKNKLIGYEPKPMKKMEPVEASSESDVEEIVAPPKPKPKTPSKSFSKSGILKQSLGQKFAKPKAEKSSPVKKQKPEENRVKYVDFQNKFSKTYIPKTDLVTHHPRQTESNAMADANKQRQANNMSGINDEILKQLAEVRSKEALEKEKTRRDYEHLRMELDELSKQEKEAKAIGKTQQKYSIDNLKKQENSRQKRMNLAVENALRRNIITCPPVDCDVAGNTNKKAAEVNVASSGQPQSSWSSDAANIGIPMKSKTSTDEVTNIVKIERLKDLLERINHQKRLLLKEIEKSEDVPGPDLEKVMKCLEKLEKEKAALDTQAVADKKCKELNAKAKEIDDILDREKKLREREKRLEQKIKELYRQEQQKEATATKSESAKESPQSISTSSASEVPVQPPVEIIIKVHQKSPYKKKRKSFRCIDTLNHEPGRIYPKTPVKRRKEIIIEKTSEPVAPVPQKVQQETQTSPQVSEPPKTILKKPREAQKPSTASMKFFDSRRSDSSESTSYQILPQRINVEDAPLVSASQFVSKKNHHKLNPVLMHYITRLLGMGRNIGNQLSVNVSSVSTPGTSTINTTGNIGSEVPSFDEDRLDKLKKFIDDNYSFLSEINDTIERSDLHDQNDETIGKVDNIWRDVLRQKKFPTTTTQSKASQVASQNQSSKSLKSNVREIPVETVKIPKKPSLHSLSSISNRPVTVQSDQQKIKLSVPVQQRPAPIQQQSPPIQQPSAPIQQQSVPIQQQSAPIQQQSAPVERPLPIQQQSASVQRSLHIQQQSVPIEIQSAPVQQQSNLRTAPAAQSQITNRDLLNVTKYLESHMLNNYAEYTANCQQRIADLAQMMERVRQEKLKLIENSLSSGEFANFTEYKEILIQEKQQQDAPTTSVSDRKDSPSQREDPPSEEINNILQTQTRPFGVSKDSGISIISRPVTSSDFRDSPDARVTSEEKENTFQPILRDIPKPSKTISVDQTEVIKDIPVRPQQLEPLGKKLRPPLSLNRFSPQLAKPHEPHELSVIAEVETPSTSKVNIPEFAEQSTVGLQTFPNYENYANNLNISEHPTIDPSLPSMGFLEQLSEHLNIKSFADPQMYGIPEISQDANDEPLSNASSIQDILVELRRRNILEGSDFEDNGNGDLAFDDENPKTTPTATVHVKTPNSPRKKQMQSRIIIKTPENIDVDVQEIKTPTKKKQPPSNVPEPENHISDDTLSGIQEIEKEPRDDFDIDFQKMGLNWAGSMMKRCEQSKNLQSSSSSSSIERREKSIEIEFAVQTSSTSNTSSSSGQPLNLREFLKRELAKKSEKDKYLSDESSLSSQFMRSLLNATSGNASSSGRSSQNGDLKKLRTSTPMQLKTSVTQTAIKSVASNTLLFSSDSLSTVRVSGASKDGSGGS